MIRKEKSEIMKKVFIIFITIIGFISIENVVYAYPSTIINANTVTTLANVKRNKERRIEEKFTELYQDKEDFAELYNILTIDEKELLNENYSLENYEKEIAEIDGRLYSFSISGYNAYCLRWQQDRDKQ